MEAFTFDDATLDLAIAANRSPFSIVTRLFDGAQRKAHESVLETLVSVPAQRSALLEKLQGLRAIDVTRRAAVANQTLPDPIVLRQTVDVVKSESEKLRSALGDALPIDLAGLRTRLDGLLADTRAPYIAARVRAIEMLLAARGLGAFLSALYETAAPNDTWPAVFERAWLESHLDRIRGRIATFDGRAQDKTVLDFGSRDRSRLEMAGRRVLRAVAERFVSVAREYPERANVTRSRGREATKAQAASRPLRIGAARTLRRRTVRDGEPALRQSVFA